MRTILRMSDPKGQEATPGRRSFDNKELNSYPGTVSWRYWCCRIDGDELGGKCGTHRYKRMHTQL